MQDKCLHREGDSVCVLEMLQVTWEAEEWGQQTIDPGQGTHTSCCMFMALTNYQAETN